MKVFVIISWITAIGIFLQGEMTQKDIFNQDSLSKEKVNLLSLANLADSLGLFYEKSGQFGMAKERFQEALVYFEQVNDTLEMAKTHAKLALIYHQEDELGTAEFHLKIQGKLDSLAENKRGIGFFYDQMGVLKSKQGFQEESYPFFIKGLKIRESLNDSIGMGESISHIAQLLFELRQYREAIGYAYRLLEIAKEVKSLKLKETAYSLLSRSYESMRWFQAALDNQKHLKIIADSLARGEYSSLDAHYQSKIELLEQNHRHAMAELENLPRAEISEPNNTPIYALLITLLLLIFLLILIYFLRSRNLEQNEALSISKAEYKMLLKEAHERMEESLQLISGLLLLQDKDKVSGNGFEEGYGRAKTVALLGKSLSQKENLPKVNVKGYLLKLCSGLFKTYHVKEDQVKLILEMGNLNLDATTMVPLALIVHELVTNSLKYAFPGGQKGEIRIVLKENEGKLQLSVEDDGKGFNPSKVRPDSIGYQIIHTMVNQLQGKLEIINQGGAKISMEFQYP
ncbi:ATP-binding protein [Shivajiella indica]|uniref:histidine kinase n=1 Tax=Shivajiella indica TaxID=872115 RepID=A0ABW5B1Y5_9BACT